MGHIQLSEVAMGSPISNKNLAYTSGCGRARGLLKKFRKSILIILCVSSAAHSQQRVVIPAQPAEVSTLTAAIAEAYRSNPSLGVSRYDLKALYEAMRRRVPNND